MTVARQFSWAGPRPVVPAPCRTRTCCTCRTALVVPALKDGHPGRTPLHSAVIGIALLFPAREPTRHVIAPSRNFWYQTADRLCTGRAGRDPLSDFAPWPFWRFTEGLAGAVTASVVTAADHLIRGNLVPESVYGTWSASPGAAVEHMWWVAFEDFFLADFRCGPASTHNRALSLAMKPFCMSAPPRPADWSSHRRLFTREIR